MILVKPVPACLVPSGAVQEKYVTDEAGEVVAVKVADGWSQVKISPHQ